MVKRKKTPLFVEARAVALKAHRGKTKGTLNPYEAVRIERAIWALIDEGLLTYDTDGG